MRRLIGLVPLFWLVASVAAQEADPNATWNNRAGVATAVARVLFEHRGGPDAAESVTAIPVDLDSSSSPMLLTMRPLDGCTGFGCGLALYRLDGDSYRDTLAEIPEVRATPADQISLGGAKRGGFLELRFGNRLVAWNGRSYVEADSLPTTQPKVDRFLEVCVQWPNDDYAFDEAGTEVGSARRIVCDCTAARLGAVGLSQEQVDQYADYMVLGLDEDYENDYPAEEALGATKGQVEEARLGCLVQNDWANWHYAFAANDAAELQQPLSFDGFVGTCAAQDWIVGNSKIGSLDRAATVCGCIGRKVAANGTGQAALDGLAGFYGGTLDEDGLAAIDAKVLELSDDASEHCIYELPARQ